MYAEYTWTQLAFGEVVLGDEIVRALGGSGNKGIISSFTLTASDWPKTGAQLGDGWFVKDATARDMIDLTVKTRTGGGTVTIKWWDGDTVTVSDSWSESYFRVNPAGRWFPGIITSQTDDTTYDNRGNAISHSDSLSWTEQVLPILQVQVSLTGGYKAERPHTESIRFTMFADVQHILTDPEDGEALTIDDIKSVDLSLPIGSPEYIPMVDTARRSYIATARGIRAWNICLR